MKKETTNTTTQKATTTKKPVAKATGTPKEGDKMNKSMNPPATDIVVFSKEFCTNFKKHENAVKSGFVKAGKSFWEVALNLHWIHANEAFKVAGKDNIYDYGREKFDLSRGTIHNYIAVVERFCRPALESDMMTVREEYAAYSPSQLSIIAPLTDEAIKEAGIEPVMSCREIKRKITASLSDKTPNVSGISDTAATSAEEEGIEEGADEKGVKGTTPAPVRQVILTCIGSEDYLKHEDAMYDLIHNLFQKKPNVRLEISYFVENPTAGTETPEGQASQTA